MDSVITIFLLYVGRCRRCVQRRRLSRPRSLHAEPTDLAVAVEHGWGAAGIDVHATKRETTSEILARNELSHNSVATSSEHGLQSRRTVRCRRRRVCAHPRRPAPPPLSAHALVRTWTTHPPRFAAGLRTPSCAPGAPESHRTKLTRRPAVVSCPPQLNVHATPAAADASSLIQRGGGTGPVMPRQPALLRQVPTPAVHHTER